MKNLSFVILFAIGCTSVTPVPDPVPPSPGPSASVYEEACANLAAWGCAEGMDETCVSTLQTVQEKRLTDLAPSCLAKAASVAELRSCGTVECLTEVGKTTPATCANACAVVKKLRCPEATDCYATCTKVVAQKLTDFKLSCLVKATTKATLRACGTVECK
jgi:hypothetical protein